MKAVCPSCGEKFDLEAYLKDRVMIDVIKMLPDFGPHGRLAWEYAELFRIGPPLNARKLARILGEIREFFHGGAFEYQKKRYEISRDGLAAAMRTVCNGQIKGALTNHNYLKKVAIGVAEAEAKRRSIDAEKNLRERERAGQSGHRVEGPSTGSGQRIENLPGKVRDLLASIGGDRLEGVAEKAQDS